MEHMWRESRRGTTEKEEETSKRQEGNTWEQSLMTRMYENAIRKPITLPHKFKNRHKNLKNQSNYVTSFSDSKNF